jgi:CubicO group peptidase (beta-lactamase class C family)
MLYEKLFGEANREYDIPISRSTQFRIGSNSKTFTTIGIFQLGKVSNKVIDLNPKRINLCL